jgi:acetophenone carboxylase
LIEGAFTFSPDPDWVRILEFYCPGCGAQVETEYLPPGHPITVDIELDVDRLKARLASGEIHIEDGRIAVAEGREVTL